MQFYCYPVRGSGANREIEIVRNMAMSMNVFLRPELNWAGWIAAAPFILVAAKYLLYRWQAKLLQRWVGELRTERTRLETLIAELKQILSKR